MNLDVTTHHQPPAYQDKHQLMDNAHAHKDLPSSHIVQDAKPHQIAYQVNT